MDSNRKRLIGYWIATLLLVLPMGAGGALDVMQAEQVMETLAILGYPPYLAVLLGVLKLAGLAVLLAPGLLRVKEWAYAGMGFDLIGALISHLVVEGATQNAVGPAVFLLVLTASWALRPEHRRLDGPML